MVNAGLRSGFTHSAWGRARSSAVLWFASLALLACFGGCPPDESRVSEPLPEEPTPEAVGPAPATPTEPAVSTTGAGTAVSQKANPPPATPVPVPPELRVLVFEPVSDLTVRPGTPAKVRFSVQSTDQLPASAALVLARDDNQDKQPDGPPVFMTPLSGSLSNGEVTLATDSPEILSLLSNGLGRFRVGVLGTAGSGASTITYAAGGLTIDGQAPQADWLSPSTDTLTNRVALPATLRTTDNSPHTIQLRLDTDLVVGNGNEINIAPELKVAGGPTALHELTLNLPMVPVGVYYLHLTLRDGALPDVRYYVTTAAGAPLRLRLSDRWIGDVAVDAPSKSGGGAVLQGFNFNDLAGSAIIAVPDVNVDGFNELLVASRFGKPHLIEYGGVGAGEAFLLYGDAGRIQGSLELNAVGATLPGLVFTGVRTPVAVGKPVPASSAAWTHGLSDLAVVPEMDGDELPELVFGFPRAESVSIGNTISSVQHPELWPDIDGMGGLEFDAYIGGAWQPNQAQFTRGGVVIVSSHDEHVRHPELLNRKGNRAIDLLEVGQLFEGHGGMDLPTLTPYIREAFRRDQLPPPRNGPFQVCVDCDGKPPAGCNPGAGQCGNDGCALAGSSTTDGREHVIDRWVIQWDVIFSNQPPGGFSTQWTPVPADPPLSNLAPFPFPAGVFPFDFYPNHWADICKPTVNCEVTNEWFVWDDPCVKVTGWAVGGTPWQDPLPDCYPDNPCPVPGSPPPCGQAAPCELPPLTVNAGSTSVWTGFYPCGESWLYLPSGTYAAPIGARILGQKVDDEFGSSLSCDGQWLYMAAPRRTPNDPPYIGDVPSLTKARPKAGVVYQMRVNSPTSTGINQVQLWQEPQPSVRPFPKCGAIWFLSIPPWYPYVDHEMGFRTDPSMPFPHQYIIESVGSLRGIPTGPVRETAFGDPNDPFSCPPPYDPGVDGYDLSACGMYDYQPGMAGYYVDQTPQMVGPHPDARIERVRAVGDVNGDGIRDVVIGSEFIREDVINGTGATVGGVFVVFSRPTYLEGDYLLEQLALDVGAPNRLYGVLLKGSAPGEKLGHAFADAGDFNGDGYGDVIVGNESAKNGAGEAVLLFGSPNLVSPGPGDPGAAPGGGWTPATIPADRIIRFLGGPGDYAGSNVAGAGDVDGDGYGDILIAAPGANGQRGATYLVYGGPNVPGVVSLSALSTAQIDVSFARFIGRAPGDQLGGGYKTAIGTDPSGGTTVARSQGVAFVGDLDQDGADDMAISAMLADANNKTDAGEVYLIYGRKE